jgi:hypothetical protein
MSEERKDVTVHVIGVAMTGGVKHDSKRPSSEDTKNLEKKRLEIAESMVDGRVSDFNSYHRNVGIAEGLMQASEIIRETIKNINEEDV